MGLHSFCFFRCFASLLSWLFDLLHLFCVCFRDFEIGGCQYWVLEFEFMCLLRFLQTISRTHGIKHKTEKIRMQVRTKIRSSKPVQERIFWHFVQVSQTPSQSVYILKLKLKTLRSSAPPTSKWLFVLQCLHFWNSSKIDRGLEQLKCNHS